MTLGGGLSEIVDSYSALAVRLSELYLFSLISGWPVKRKRKDAGFKEEARVPDKEVESLIQHFLHFLLTPIDHHNNQQDGKPTSGCV